MVMLRIMRGIHEHFPARASEWALAAMLLNLGVILSLPRQTFLEAPNLAALGRIAPEDVWAIALLTLGSVRLLALVINGTFVKTDYGRYSPHVRSVLAFISCFFWMQITVGLSLGPTLATELAVYPVLLALDMYNTARAAGDAALVDRACKHEPRN